MVVEPVSASLTILAAVLSIAASIKQLAQKRHISKQEALETYSRGASGDEARILQDPGIRAAVLEITVISKDLLEQLAKEAQACERKHIRARQEAGSRLDKELADTKAAQCMCSVLRDIIKHNKRHLPENGPFRDWWESYNCEL